MVAVPREAIRIGLDNADTIRLISLNAPGPGYERDGFEIAPVRPDADAQRFKAEVMAHVRSVEQQYWSLAQQHVQLWSIKKAVEVAEETLKRELLELNIGAARWPTLPRPSSGSSSSSSTWSPRLPM